MLGLLVMNGDDGDLWASLGVTAQSADQVEKDVLNQVRPTVDVLLWPSRH